MNIIEEIKKCKKCTLCDQMPEGFYPVPGVGPTISDIMFVGEALGENEVIEQTPFVGIAGKMFDKMLAESGIDRSQSYITNVVKCRPTFGNKNRVPTAEEISACKRWLWEEIQLVNPKIIVTLGRIPTYTLLHDQLKTTFKMKDVVGIVYTVSYISSLIIPAYHPSYIAVHSKKDYEREIEIFKFVLATKR